MHGEGRGGGARVAQDGQGMASCHELISDLEPIDCMGVADVVLHQTGLVHWDGAGVRHQLDPPPS